MTTENWIIQASPKTPGGTLVNLRGLDEASFLTAVDIATRHVQEIVALETLLAGGAAAATLVVSPQQPAVAVQQDVPQPQFVGGPPPTPPAAPPVAGAGGPREEVDRWGNRYVYGHPAAPQCPHGGRIAKYGVNRSGKPYSGWVCPNNKYVGGNGMGECDMDFQTARP